ncbi:MAG: oligosaccharide flippase family protein [Bacteroidota bacterium]
MKESAILKRSAFMYAFSILFTGMVNFIAIPVLKQKIGSGEFAYLNLYMNLLLVISYIGAGWLAQSCVRFFPVVSGQPGFGNVFKKLAIISGLFTALLAFITAVFFRHYAWMLVAFPATIFFINLQSMVVAWMQASVRPKTVAMAEVLRSLVFLCFTLGIKTNSGYNLIIVAWFGWLASYLVSLLLMLVAIKKYPVAKKEQGAPAEIKALFSKFAAFGFPLSLWLAGTFVLFYADRFFLLRHWPASLVGHYSALFDVLQKGIGFVLSPLVTAAYPLLARLYEEGKHDDLKRLSRKALRWQALITATVLMGYIIAWPLLKKILAIDEAGNSFFVSGLLILGGAATWQMNMLLHKPFELQHRTLFLLAMVGICVSLLLLADWLIIPDYGFVGAASVFFASTVLYSIIILLKRR